MSQQDENAAEIKRLIEELTGVLNSMNNIEEQKQFVINKYSEPGL